MNFNLGFGPMSYRINDIIARYAADRKRPVMFIASRNQIDANSGYVMTTKEFAQQVNPLRSEYLMLCRDHCGPYFLDSEKSLSLKAAVEATKTTIAGDIENGFNLIHIDTSRCEDVYTVAEELIQFSLSLNPNVKFEFGTEENVGVTAGIKKYKDDVKFASQFANMEFVVAQTGSLTMEDRQVGTFESDAVAKLSKFAEEAGIKLKEHNADYLTAEQIQLRKAAGVHALNIAPQLGVIQTKLLLSLAEQYGLDTGYFTQRVLDSGKWRKWMLDGDDEVRIAVAGHYCYNTEEYFRLEDSVSQHCDFSSELEKAIGGCLDLYFENLL